MKAVDFSLIAAAVLLSFKVMAFDLVTESQYLEHGNIDGSLIEGIEPKTRSIAIDKPVIELVQPSDIANTSLKSPMDIELRFTTAPDAEIAIDTLRVKFFLLDITDTLLENAQVQGNILIARGAEVPAGKYSLTVSIRDSKKRRAKKKFRFVVSD